MTKHLEDKERLMAKIGGWMTAAAAALFLAAPVRGERPVSAAFFFASDLLRALYDGQRALDAATEGASAVELRSATALLKRHLDSGDPIVRRAAAETADGLRRLEKGLRRPAPGSGQKEARDMIARNVGSIYALLREPGDEAPRAKALNVSYDESVALLDQIDLYFGAHMRRHPEHWTALAQGFKEEPSWEEASSPEALMRYAEAGR